MDEFDEPIPATAPTRIGEPGRRGAPLGILHEWKVRVEQIDKILFHPRFNPAGRYAHRLIEEKQKLQAEADVASAWKQDPVLNQKIIGTNPVHIPTGRPN
jgi:hypothetical protein